MSRHNGRPDHPNFLLMSTFSTSRSGAWAKLLVGNQENVWKNTPQNRRKWRDRGTRPVRVILHQIGDGGCRA